MILDLHRQGLSVSAIARQTGLDRKTIRKYIQQGLSTPTYGPRSPRPTLIDPFAAYLTDRLTRHPGLSASRLMREIKALGYAGGYTRLKDFVRAVRPAAPSGFERRFETPPGRQAQVDFAHFKTTFTDEPGTIRIVWLFSIVLGHSRYLWARFVAHQDLHAVIRCHVAAFEHFGGVPGEILYDQMKTVVIGAEDDGPIIYNKSLVALASHYGFTPKACKPYRAQTKGKVERPFRYIRQDFFLGRDFRDLEDLNAQLAQWLGDVANPRVHGTTGRVVNEAFAEERPQLQPLPATPHQAVLKLERRISHDGMVSVGGNLYSVPDATRKRVVEVHTLPNEIRIFEAGQLVAAHPVLEGRRKRSLLPGHRRAPAAVASRGDAGGVQLRRPGEIVAQRPLAVYEAIAHRLAEGGAR